MVERERNSIRREEITRSVSSDTWGGSISFASVGIWWEHTDLYCSWWDLWWWKEVGDSKSCVSTDCEFVSVTLLSVNFQQLLSNLLNAFEALGFCQSWWFHSLKCLFKQEFFQLNCCLCSNFEAKDYVFSLLNCLFDCLQAMCTTCDIRMNCSHFFKFCLPACLNQISLMSPPNGWRLHMGTFLLKGIFFSYLCWIFCLNFSI